jgi:hypothetical protein
VEQLGVLSGVDPAAYSRDDPMSRGPLVSALAVLIACVGQFGLTGAAGAQQPVTVRHIGVLLVLLSPDGKEAQAFRRGLREAGYAEGRDVVIEWRSANGDYAKVPQSPQNWSRARPT